MSLIKSFTDLNAWKQSHQLVLLIYKITTRFPGSQQFSLVNQMQRAAVSITSNIAEGFSRKSKKEKSQFYYTSLGSLTELQNQLLIAKDLEYIKKEEFKNIADQTVVVSKLINGLIKSSKILTTYYMIHNTHISAIAIISKNRGLGFENKLLFHIPGELPRFKTITTGHPVIMGRKTHESIDRLLPNRTNIIITRDSSYKIDGAIIVHDLPEAIDVAKKSPGADEIFIIGGGQTFTEALPMTDRLYLTVVDTEVSADTFFPDYSEFTKVITEEKHTEWGHPYTFLTLERK